MNLSAEHTCRDLAQPATWVLPPPSGRDEATGSVDIASPKRTHLAD
jgi:hypothetical protein